jgi:hypothetical protein
VNGHRAVLRGMLLLGAGLFLAPAALRAQAITGTVRDAMTRLPVGGTSISVVDTEGVARVRVLADDAGRFRIAVPPGAWSLRAENVGYDVLETEPVTVGERETVTVEVRIGPRPVEIEPLIVETRQRYRAARIDAFQRRAAWSARLGLGRIITREEIDRAPPSTVYQMLAREPGVRLISTGFRETVVLRGRGGECAPEFYLNGQFLGTDPEIVRTIMPDALEGAEIYRALEAPAELLVQNCGAVALWTRMDGGRPFTWRRALAGAAAVGAVLIMSMQ